MPQAGAVSGKAHYMNTLTGEVREEHPHKEQMDAMVADVRNQVDAQQVSCSGSHSKRESTSAKATNL